MHKTWRETLMKILKEKGTQYRERGKVKRDYKRTRTSGDGIWRGERQTQYLGTHTVGRMEGCAYMRTPCVPIPSVQEVRKIKFSLGSCARQIQRCFCSLGPSWWIFQGQDPFLWVRFDWERCYVHLQLGISFYKNDHIQIASLITAVIICFGLTCS